ncbi:mms-19, partial [Pristionchus pacificus]
PVQMANAVELDFSDEQWAHEMLTKLVDQHVSLSNALEDLRPLLYGSSEDKERALERLVALVLKLPSDFLTEDQIHLLLSFFLDRLDTSGLAATRVIDAIRHLLIESKRTSKDAALLSWKSLYQEGNVQAWSVNQRLVLYEILEWLCTKQKSATLPIGSEFVLSFIKSIGGERDPRCLSIAFRLFVLISKEWSLGPFIEEMFETIACYYPIQFKPKGDQSITKESLSIQCELCLLSHSGFAPFCFLMIEEKLTEDGMEQSMRGEVCAFLSRAVSAFPASSLPPHSESLLSAIRAVTFDPNDKYGDNAAIAAESMRRIMLKLNQLDCRHVNAAIDHTMENIEPFVLQAEMGVSLRAFDLLETLCLPSSSASNKDGTQLLQNGSVGECVPSVRSVVSRSISWALALVQGETTNTAANKGDVCKDGLEALVKWIEVTTKVGCQDEIVKMERTILASIDSVIPLVGREARVMEYGAAALMIAMNKEEGRIDDQYCELLKRGLYSIEMDMEERKAFLSFVTAHSFVRWNLHQSIISQAISLGEETTEQFALNRIDVLCASVHSENSWETLSGRIWNELEVVSEEGSHILLEFVRSDRGKKLGVDRLAREYQEFVEKRLPKSALIGLSSCIDIWQEWGSIVSDECHKILVESILSLLEEEDEDKRWMRNSLAHFYVLLIGQAKDDNSLYRLISLVVSGRIDSTCELRSILYFIQVNRHGEESIAALSITHMIESDSEEVLRLGINAAKAHLLVGIGRPGVQETKKILCVLSSHSSPSPLLDLLLDYSTPLFETDKNELNASPLWRQRISYQLVPLFEEAVRESKTREWKITLLSALRHIVKLSANDASFLAPLLDTLISCLVDISINSSSISNESMLFLVESLDQLIERTEEKILTKEKVAGIVHSLCLLVENRKTENKVLFTAIKCIRNLLSTASPITCQPSITRVIRALARASGHSKRTIRTCAADARNRWELLGSV